MKISKLFLKIGWLYPDLMSTYGDRGNITCIIKRCEWRGIKTQIIKIQKDISLDELNKVDLIFGGGAQDRQQEIVMSDLIGTKANILKKLINSGIPALFVCGSPQLMGNYYQTADGKIIKGLGIFNIITKNPSYNKKRFIGNVVAEVLLNNLDKKFLNPFIKRLIIVGFENHGGRTYLLKDTKPLARVIKGYGNNGEDKTEGIIYKNALGTYMHGPFLSKNPEITDYLIEKSLLIKYKKYIRLTKLNDNLEFEAKKSIINK